MQTTARTPEKVPAQRRPSTEYLLSDELVLFIVRFGLRITANRWGMSERTLWRLYRGVGLRLGRSSGTSGSGRLNAFLPQTSLCPRSRHHLGFATERAFSRWVHEHFGESPTGLRRILRRPA